MKKKQHIFLYLILAGFIFSVLSCGRASEKDVAIAAQDSVALPVTDELESSFETDSLSAAQLNAFQQRARQKVQDFINYVEIISNKSYNSELRDEAGKQIRELFADSTATVSIPVFGAQKKTIPVSGFLNELYKSEYDSVKVKTDSVVIFQPKRSDDSTKYAGSLTAKVMVSGYKNGKVIFNSNTVQTAETIIYKAEKQFGTETKQVWTAEILGLK